MKRFIIISFVILLGIIANAQVVKEGNTFKQNKEKTEVVEQKTSYQYEDSKGNKYPIYKSKRGSLYVIKTSKKTGKEYKYYLPKDIQEEIKKHIQIKVSFDLSFLNVCCNFSHLVCEDRVVFIY